jgi:alpha-ketoglutarate-dependent taurine dioxygenase
MSDEESRRVLWQLYRAATRPEVTYEDRWTAADLVVWDNRCVLLHRTPAYAPHHTNPRQPDHQRFQLHGQQPHQADEALRAATTSKRDSAQKR